MSVTVMKKLTVLASLRDADKLVRRLMRLRCVDIASVPLGICPTAVPYCGTTATARGRRLNGEWPT